MCAKRLDDWRIEASAELATGVPPAFPGGPSFKPGDTVQLVTVSKNADGQLIGFITPSATALALSIAIRAAKRSTEIRDKVVYRASISPMGTIQMIDPKDSPRLFDFFEHCMIAVTFSFQAIEVFCNHTISRNLKQPMKVKGRKNAEEMSPTEIERKLSTEEKLGYVLPKVFKVGTPRGKAIWQKFKNLQRVRDSTIHLKGADQIPLGGHDTVSLFFEFFNHDPIEFPESASDIIRYFFKRTEEPEWLRRLPSLQT